VLWNLKKRYIIKHSLQNQSLTYYTPYTDDILITCNCMAAHKVPEEADDMTDTI
jgi:hypothetical protein